jgi:hypothetical protein
LIHSNLLLQVTLADKTAELTVSLLSPLSAGEGSGGEAVPKVIKRLIIRKPGEKRALEKAAQEAAAAANLGGCGPLSGDLLLEGPLAKKRKSEGGVGRKSVDGESVEGNQLGPFPSGKQPNAVADQLKRAHKKSLRIKKKMAPREAEGGSKLKRSSKDKSSPKKRPKKGSGEVHELGSARPEGELASQPGRTHEDILEDAQIAALVKALRARGAREVRAKEELEMAELDERLRELEVQQRGIASELEQLRAQRQVLQQQRLGRVGEQDVAEPIRAAREKCLQAIVELLGELVQAKGPEMTIALSLE